MLLYICHVAANDGLVAIVSCPSLRCLRVLARHGALQHLRAQPPGRLAAVFHLTHPAVSSTREYRRWAERLPGQQVRHDPTRPGPAAQPIDSGPFAISKTSRAFDPQLDLLTR